MSTIEFLFCWNAPSICPGNWWFEKMAVKIVCDDGIVYRAAIRFFGLTMGTTWIRRK